MMECIRRHDASEIQTDYKSLVIEQSGTINNDMEASMSTTRTLEVMNVCKIKIIGPFNVMLTMVGWRSLMTQFPSSERCSLLTRCLDKFLLIVFIALLIFSCIYQVLACRFKMNIHDQIMTIGPPITTVHPNRSTTVYQLKDYLTAMSGISNNESKQTYIYCEHLTTTYAIPNLLHFIAYILGLIHYRYRENEDIYGLMEKTLQYSATLGLRRNNYSIVSRMLKCWMIMAFIWVLLAISNHIFYDVIYNTYASPVYIFKINPDDDNFSSNIKHLMFILDFFGYVIMCVVTVTIVLNYTIYCELVKFYVDAISKKIEMRRIKLNVLRNDIDNVSGTIRLINGMIGTMMTLIFFFKLNLLIVGINYVMSLHEQSSLEMTFRLYYVLHLFPLIVTALIQCVRVNRAMKTFKRWGRHMSVFGYRKESKKELDSFLLFTSGFNSKARLMAIPLEYWHLLLLIIALTFILITLIQTGVLNNTEIFKKL